MYLGWLFNFKSDNKNLHAYCVHEIVIENVELIIIMNVLLWKDWCRNGSRDGMESEIRDLYSDGNALTILWG
jgi:hypothetical protein